MSREVLHETLSAVMDNEADELELRRVLAATGDAELRAKWSRYQLARLAIHKETPEPSFDISGAVAAAIAQEDSQVEVQKPSRWYQLGRVAVAATVTLAVLAGVRFYNHEQAPELAQQTENAATQSLASASDAVKEGGNLAAQHEQQASDFIRQHAQTASLQQEEEVETNTSAQ